MSGRIIAGLILSAAFVTIFNISVAAEQPDPNMSCEQFKATLAEVIHKEGDKVAVPSGFQVDYSTPGDPHIRYRYAETTGISGHLDCVNGNFAGFDISADLGETDIRTNGLRLIRSWALTEAALCTRERMTDDSCHLATLAIAKAAMTQFLEARNRGSEHPNGDSLKDFTNTELDITFTDSGTVISLKYRPMKQ